MKSNWCNGRKLERPSSTCCSDHKSEEMRVEMGNNKKGAEGAFGIEDGINCSVPPDRNARYSIFSNFPNWCKHNVKNGKRGNGIKEHIRRKQHKSGESV